MDSVVEHVFSGFMIFLLISACLFGVNAYVNSSIMNSKSFNSLKGVFEYLSLMLFSDDVASPALTSKMDFLCSKIFPNIYMDYDSLKDLLDLDEYGFAFSLYYPLTINLDLNGRDLWCSIRSNVNLLPMKGTIFIYAFVNGSLLDKVTLFVSESGGYYRFDYPPEMVVATVYFNNLWSFNWTGNFNQLLVFPYYGFLYLTGCPISSNGFLLSECFIGGDRVVALSSGDIVKFFSQYVREETALKGGRREALLFFSGSGKVKVSLGVAEKNYGVSKMFSSEIIYVDSSMPEGYLFSLDVQSSVKLLGDNRVYFEVYCLEGDVKMYFGSKVFSSRISLSLVPNVFSEGLYFKAPAKSLNLYLLTHNDVLLDLGSVESESGVFQIERVSTPSLFLAFSPESSEYYVMPFPNIVRRYGGIPGDNCAVFSKIVSIMGYPYIFKVFLWRYSFEREIKELSFLIDVVPSQISIMSGFMSQAVVNVVKLKNDATIRVLLNVYYSKRVFRNVTLTKSSGLIPFKAKLFIQPHENASQGEYNILIEGKDDGGTAVSYEVKVKVLPRPSSDFTISIKPTVVTAKQWSNTLTTVFLNPVQGYNYNVNLEASNLPDNVTVSFNPPGDIPPFESVCSISVGSTMPGSYQIVIIAIGEDGKNHSSIITLSVVGIPPDFTLTIFPDETMIRRGESATFIVKVDPINNFNKPVTLRVSRIPPFSIFSLSPSTGYPPLTSTLIISTSYFTLRRTYRIVVTGISDSISHKVTIRLEVV